MLRGLNGIIGFKVASRDDKFGHVYDFYWEDHFWTVRYVVVDTGAWLPGKLILVSPVEVEALDVSSKSLPVRLTREKIENGPTAEQDRPVSRQREVELSRHYGWPAYWERGGDEQPFAPIAEPAEPKTGDLPSPRGVSDPHLRSLREVTGYHIHATDGELGHVEDVIADLDDWRIRYLVVNTRNWLPGRHVLVSPGWFRRIAWEERLVYADLTCDEIRNSPVYDRSQPIDRAYEAALHEHYGRETYWE